MTKQTTPLKTILLADDGTENMIAAVKFLSDLPGLEGASVFALRVFTATEGSEFSRIEQESQVTKNYLKSRHFHFSSEAILGDPVKEIVSKAETLQPDLIVMGGKAIGKFGGLLGNVATEVSRAGKWPVLIIKKPYEKHNKILLAVDGSEYSDRTAAYLNAFPLQDPCCLTVATIGQPVQVTYPIEPAGMALAAISPAEEESMNRENLAGARTVVNSIASRMTAFSEVKTIARLGDPVEEILDILEEGEYDLLVCGSRGHGNLSGWLLGSVSRSLVRSARSSVLIFRSG